MPLSAAISGEFSDSDAVQRFVLNLKSLVDNLMKHSALHLRLLPAWPGSLQSTFYLVFCVTRYFLFEIQSLRGVGCSNRQDLSSVGLCSFRAVSCLFFCLGNPHSWSLLLLQQLCGEISHVANISFFKRLSTNASHLFMYSVHLVQPSSIKEESSIDVCIIRAQYACGRAIRLC